MIINVKRPGQLGNQLFLHAHLMAYSIEYEQDFINLAFTEYNSLFKGTVDQSVATFPKFSRFWMSLVRITFVKKAITRIARHFAIFELFPLSYYFLDTPKRNYLSSYDKIVGKGELAIMNGWLFHSDDLLKKHLLRIRSYFAPIEEIQVHLDQKKKILNFGKRLNLAIFPKTANTTKFSYFKVSTNIKLC